jgi:RNA polymerase sigma-70 factor (ECF subfamily)
VRDARNAEDVLGEVMVDVVRRLPTFSGDVGGFQAWLFRIAHNRLVDDVRRRETRRETVVELPPEPDAGPDVADVVIDRESSDRLQQMLRVLPPDQRTAVYLSCLHVMTLAEYATSMYRSEASANMLHGRSMRTLAERLEARRSP